MVCIRLCSERGSWHFRVLESLPGVSCGTVHTIMVFSSAAMIKTALPDNVTYAPAKSLLDCTSTPLLMIAPIIGFYAYIHARRRPIHWPFPVQRVQTDRGREFFAVKVQERFKQCSIKFRPNKPGSPHLNGKVERYQQTPIGLNSMQWSISLMAAWTCYWRNGNTTTTGTGRTVLTMENRLWNTTFN